MKKIEVRIQKPGFRSQNSERRQERRAATAGMRTARRAGIQHASNATKASATGTPTKVMGSPGETPNSKLAIRCVAPCAAINPTTTPVSVRMAPGRNESSKMSRGSAPESHPNAEFLRPLADGIGHDAINSNGCQKQCQCAKDCHQGEREPAASKRSQPSFPAWFERHKPAGRDPHPARFL